MPLTLKASTACEMESHRGLSHTKSWTQPPDAVRIVQPASPLSLQRSKREDIWAPKDCLICLDATLQVGVCTFDPFLQKGRIRRAPQSKVDPNRSDPVCSGSRFDGTCLRTGCR